MVSRTETPATSNVIGQKLDAAIALLSAVKTDFLSAGNGSPEISATTIRSLINAHALLANICLCAQTPALRYILNDDIVSLLEYARNQVGQNSIIELPQRQVPSWDPDRHELVFNGMLIKKFKLPSYNQERVLTTFQEENWPARIDNPLPPGRIPVKQQLHDTIKCLNRNQKNRRVRFQGDGTGEGVLWEPIPIASKGEGQTR